MNDAGRNSEPSLAIATCSAYAELDIDDQLLLEPLRGLGLRPRILVWDDPTVQWELFDLVLIRSTWDYTRHHAEFLEWARKVESASVLANPVSVIAWSSVKTYLRDLANAGVPIVPTSFIAPGQDWTFPEGQFVVKPTISAGSRDTVRLSSANHAAGDSAIAALHSRQQVAMIQPYFHSVDVQAETAMIFFEGEFSHAISKAALLALDEASPTFERGLFLKEKIAGRAARADQLAVARAALACAPDGWLYARVDLIDDQLGNPVVLELEMVEPSLFLGFHDSDSAEPSPASRLAQIIAKTLAAQAN